MDGWMELLKQHLYPFFTIKNSNTKVKKYEKYKKWNEKKKQIIKDEKMKKACK